ncbi:peptide-methionine (S)-S-oxide reductase [Alkalicoccus daliensis]|uniref:peptide-methionine (S)-S-oxide reductase n=1 Tax=Alkalicoccus daliensis TaxID=745820 RepID=A0A1G9ZI95_9BACI|nr:peptide-methionine (S)-S-oxide reductase [Alkalicoccus daliensis]
MGNHTECIEIDYDPLIISYEDLLHEFWTLHSGKNHGYGGRQYLSLLLFRSNEEKQTALKVRTIYEERKGSKIDTELSAFQSFYPAENYHQKYSLRRFKKAWEPLQNHFSSEEDIRDSLLAAKLNAAAQGELTMNEIYSNLSLWTADENQQQEWKKLLQSVKW